MVKPVTAEAGEFLHALEAIIALPEPVLAPDGSIGSPLPPDAPARALAATLRSELAAVAGRPQSLAQVLRRQDDGLSKLFGALYAADRPDLGHAIGDFRDMMLMSEAVNGSNAPARAATAMRLFAMVLGEPR